jgi:hypothetical protein
MEISFEDLTSNSMVDGTKTQYHFPQLPMSVTQLQTFRKLPVGFQDLALTGELTIETIDFILEIAYSKDRSKALDARLRTSFATSKAEDRNEPKHSLLCEACPGLTMADTAAGPALERMLCTALMRACIDESHRFKTPGSLFQSLTAKLQRLLPLAAVPADGPERSCLLWVWLSILDAWPGRFEAVVDWLHRVRRLFPEIKHWSVEDFEAFGRGYIWTPDLSRIFASHWPMMI